MKKEITISGPAHLRKDGTLKVFLGLQSPILDLHDIAKEYAVQKTTSSTVLEATFNQEQSAALAKLVTENNERIEAFALEIDSEDEDDSQYKIDIVGVPAAVERAAAWLSGYLHHAKLS